MCLAIPAKVEKILGSKALVNWPGLKKEIDLSLMAEVKVGDYVLVHVGFAIQKIDSQKAQETLKIFEDLIKNEKTTPGKRTH